MATKDQPTRPKALTPKLRFPEFKDGPEWETAPLDELAEFVSDRISVNQLSVSNYVSTENILPEFGGITTAAKLPSTNGATKFVVDDILISNIRPYLKKVWQADRDGGASNDVIVIRPKEGSLKRYLPVVLKSDAFISYVMNGAKGVKMPRGDIASIENYPVYQPTADEQRKIAACLTSLDELLAAEGRKLEALRAHKKGLMQQLFPRQGESRPCLRFPEFRDAPEWKESTIQDLIDRRFIIGHLDGNHGELYPRADEFVSEGVPYITANASKTALCNLPIACAFPWSERSSSRREWLRMATFSLRTMPRWGLLRSCGPNTSL